MSIRSQLLPGVMQCLPKHLLTTVLATVPVNVVPLIRGFVLAGAVGTLAILPMDAQEILPAAQRASIDITVADVLSATGTPSASIAVVRDAKIVYEQAYGASRQSPKTAATPRMRYSIGSISKQFTATAILLLAEERKLSLDDKVEKWFPELTRASEVSVRQLLSMTAGYQDFWPQDYVFTDMLRPTSPRGILDRWARKALDFDPGAKWQYSNTNYTIAGLIVEKVSGIGLFDFLQRRVFTPLGMASVADADVGPLSPTDAQGYMRYALGPLRPAPKESRGWLFGCGQLAMTAHDLALWHVSIINRTVLAESSYRIMQTDALLESGLGSRYGLGVSVEMVNGRRRISHGGAASGYYTWDEIYPDEQTAIVVFTNLYSPAAVDIGGRIATIVFDAADAAATKALNEARQVFRELQKGRIDRTLLTENASAYFSVEALADFAASLAPLGAPAEFVQMHHESRGGMTFRSFRIKGGRKTLTLTTRTLPDGRLEQYLIQPGE